MVTKFDARQTISRDTLNQLVNATGQELDNILRAINAEVTPPLFNEVAKLDCLVIMILVTRPEATVIAESAVTHPSLKALETENCLLIS